MLSSAEQIAFILLVLVCGFLAFHGFRRIYAIVSASQPSYRTDNLPQRLIKALIEVGLQKPLFRARPVVSLFHAFIFFGFSFYLLVNVNDLIEAYIKGWTTIGSSHPLVQAFNLFSDLFSIFVLVGIVYFLIRRFIGKPKVFEFNSNVKLQPAVAEGGIRQDSLIVGTFIILHVGSRWLGTAFHLAEREMTQWSMPTASLIAPFFVGWSGLETGIHVTWWLTMGLIVIFLPYFPRSKHIHIFLAPLNLAFVNREAKGKLTDPQDSSKPGAAMLEELPWKQVFDSYACIMCTRCHEVCPAHQSGTPLSPSALEINKRYFINQNAAAMARGETKLDLLKEAISEDAVWSCTTCMACVEVCPVGNEPMQDILQIRRKLVFDSKMPVELADALRSLDEQGNSFGESSRKRTRWIRDLNFTIKDATKEAVEFLWYVGDFASFNQNCVETTRKVAQVLTVAGVNFGIIMKGEKSSGNDARRVGEEGLFDALAEENIQTLAMCDFQQILTTDPHTFNALKNEYPARGGEYSVKHYSTILLELIQSGRIKITKPLKIRGTYHDPCYLGRYNGVFDAPREVMRLCGVELVEMPRNRTNSFCCGAGGGQVWKKEHEDMKQRPSENRIEEALFTGASHFTVACPKDMSMYTDAVKTSGNEEKMVVRDIIDYVADAMDLEGLIAVSQKSEELLN
ncbi:MAG: heterodisulfide reductase-related iron-sulfur binding cluster [SAR324 cluster bacterium]|nr:heterodisulfide reductase-related iron-sulfur binding cluster [SAR324 cluster bacterium]